MVLEGDQGGRLVSATRRTDLEQQWIHHLSTPHGPGGSSSDQRRIRRLFQ